MISKQSLLDYQTYENIFKYEGFYFEVKNNEYFENIYDKILITDEKVINSEKAKNHFVNQLKNVKFFFDTTVSGYKKIGDKIIVTTNKEMEFNCDLLLDCTYNQLGLSKCNYTYELTISILYEKINNNLFDAITIMDGKFWSLYPRDVEKKLYTLTDVEFTPIISSVNYRDILNYEVKDGDIDTIRSNMEKKVEFYYRDFLKDFSYKSYFLSKKTKLISGSDSRDITIEEIEDNIITVNCGKIYGIFDFEEYIFNYLDNL